MGLFDALGGILSGGASGAAGGPLGMIVGGVLGGIGGMAKEKENKAMTKQQLDLMLRNAKEEALQKRQFDLEDRAYRQGGIAKFQQYYNPNYTSLSSGHAPIPGTQMGMPGGPGSTPLPNSSVAPGATTGSSTPSGSGTSNGIGGFASASNNPLLANDDNGRSGFLRQNAPPVQR